MTETTTAVRTEAQAPPALSDVVIPLFKGVIYREDDLNRWQSLLQLQSTVRDYVSVLGLDLMLDEGEGYAFLRSRESEEDSNPMPRLVTRRPLSFPVSLLLALLRKKLAETDASGGETRLILTREQITELIRVFLPDSTNEVRLLDQVNAHLNKVIDLGFVRRLRDQADTFEVRRILKAYVDAQWLADFDERLAEYRSQLEGGSPADPESSAVE